MTSGSALLCQLCNAGVLQAKGRVPPTDRLATAVLHLLVCRSTGSMYSAASIKRFCSQSSKTAPIALKICCACRYVTVYGRTKTSANGKTHRQNVKIQRLVTPERLQRKRRRAAIKKGRITKVMGWASFLR